MTHERQPKTAEAAARALGLTPRIVRAQSAAELAPAFDAALDARAEALVVLVSPMFLANRAQITALAARHRLPAMYFSPVWTESGGLIAYGPSPEEQWQLLARQIDRLLKGASAATLPVQQPTRFELTLNLRTASALGLTIPSGIRQRADRVVE